MLNPSQREVCTVWIGHPVHFTLKAEFLEVHIKYLCTPFQLCKCCYPVDLSFSTIFTDASCLQTMPIFFSFSPSPCLSSFGFPHGSFLPIVVFVLCQQLPLRLLCESRKRADGSHSIASHSPPLIFSPFLSTACFACQCR